MKLCVSIWVSGDTRSDCRPKHFPEYKATYSYSLPSHWKFQSTRKQSYRTSYQPYTVSVHNDSAEGLATRRLKCNCLFSAFLITDCCGTGHRLINGVSPHIHATYTRTWYPRYRVRCTMNALSTVAHSKHYYKQTTKKSKLSRLYRGNIATAASCPTSIGEYLICVRCILDTNMSLCAHVVWNAYIENEIRFTIFYFINRNYLAWRCSCIRAYCWLSVNDRLFYDLFYCTQHMGAHVPCVRFSFLHRFEFQFFENTNFSADSKCFFTLKLYLW